MEQVMMESVLNCGANGWPMLAAGVVTYGTLVLAGAALIKYLFFGGRSHAAGLLMIFQPSEAWCSSNFEKRDLWKRQIF